MNIEEELKSIQQDILKLKTGQGTKGDSSNYYYVEYNPGWYVVPDQNHSYQRDHTIKCIPYNNEKNAIFMPVLCASDWNVGGSNDVGRLLTYSQNIITWSQAGYTSQQLSVTGNVMGVPKGFMIFSNVKFYIETSYVDSVW